MQSTCEDWLQNPTHDARHHGMLARRYDRQFVLSVMTLRRFLACLLVCLATLPVLLVGCASGTGTGTSSPPGSGPQSSEADYPANPARWIGRWVGPSSRDYLQIMPLARTRHYAVTLQSGYTHARYFDAWQVNTGLDFQRDDQAATIRAGHGSQGLDPAMAELNDCLLLTNKATGEPPTAYCRRADTADALPLARGSYVQVRSTCWDAAPADLLYFDGTGLAEADQRACRAAITRQQGISYTLTESCTPALGGQRVASRAQIIVADDRHFARQPVGGEATLYEYCPGKPIPSSIANDER